MMLMMTTAMMTMMPLMIKIDKHDDENEKENENGHVDHEFADENGEGDDDAENLWYFMLKHFIELKMGDRPDGFLPTNCSSGD